MARTQRRLPSVERVSWPPRVVMRRAGGLRTLEAALNRSGLGPVAGVDEAGRGPSAGPLVVAACMLSPKAHDALAGLDDSKKLTEAAREELYPVITRLALAWHVVVIPAWEIDAIGIHVANLEGMRRAVAGLGRTPGYVLTDGFRVPGIPVPSLPVVGGDATAACIAAASVLAKVTRDRMMVELDQRLPGYGFAAHKGYNTPEHNAALRQLGPCVEHRRSWRNVREHEPAGAGGRPVRHEVVVSSGSVIVDQVTSDRLATEALHTR
ncbi:ribonuclease HII [Nocardia cyriacigeorgica]|uniref:Ribonuclease HII n=1 Tax=Nocardia cyriacigeorgica TaxID=135487 RepID=A0A5R8NVA4_9NOCA|nr:ribonuclease HII [Nocardia cyriacigeorgica]TLF79660.1 ribonuclease HII [Nocardia cyriacigeorgica]